MFFLQCLLMMLPLLFRFCLTETVFLHLSSSPSLTAWIYTGAFPKNFSRNISLAGVGSELKAAHTHHLLHNTVGFIVAEQILLYFCCCQCTSLLWVSIFTLLFLLYTFLCCFLPSLVQNGARNIPLYHFPLNRSCIICFLLMLLEIDSAAGIVFFLTWLHNYHMYIYF